MLYSLLKASRRLLPALLAKCGFIAMLLWFTSSCVNAQTPRSFLPKIDASKVDVGINLSLDTENKLELTLSAFNYGMSLGTGTSISFSIPSALTLVNTIPNSSCSGASYDQAKSLLTIPYLGSGQECRVRFVVTNPQNVKTISTAATLLEARDVNAINDKVWPTFNLEASKGSDPRSLTTTPISIPNAPPNVPQGAAFSTENSKTSSFLTCDHNGDYEYDPGTFNCDDGTKIQGYCALHDGSRCGDVGGFYLVNDTWTSAQRGRVQYLIDNNCVNSDNLWGVLEQQPCPGACCNSAVAAFPTGSTSTAGPFQLLHTDIAGGYNGAICQDFFVFPQPTPPCAINSFTVTPTCNNNGTASVTTDDYRTFSITASGSGTASTYNASVNNSGTLTPTSGTFGSATSFRLQNGSAGNSTNYTITLTDATNSSCTQTATISDPGICSTPPVCSINTPTVNSTCNNNGTASDPSDDTFSFTIQTTGANAGTSYKVEKTNPSPTSTVFASVNYGSTSAASSAFAISGGNLTLKLTDNTTSTCALSPVTVPAPATCSSAVACSFTATSTTPVCNNNGTPNITTDDTYTFNVTATSVSGTSATGYSANDPLSTMGTYGAAKSFGPYSIASNGTLNVTLTDKATGSCTFALPTITAPSPCSTPVVVGQPDLELTKLADKTMVVSGNTLTYTLTLKNTGTAAATGVKVKDSIPAGLTYVSSVPSQGTYTKDTGIWDVGNVAIGATLTLTITVTVN
jgi:uncharacterized repeat protein (TIGR01451 family)